MNFFLKKLLKLENFLNKIFNFYLLINIFFKMPRFGKWLSNIFQTSFKLKISNKKIKVLLVGFGIAVKKHLFNLDELQKKYFFFRVLKLYYLYNSVILCLSKC